MAVGKVTAVMLALLVLVGPHWSTAAASPGHDRRSDRLGTPADCESIAGVPITWDIDYFQDIQPIFEQRCSNCHVDHGGSPLGDLDLDPKWSWDNLVLQQSVGDPDVLRVLPGEPLASSLFLKVNCDNPGFGSRMPLGRPPLPLAEQALIFDWIAAGAPAGATDIIFYDGFQPRP